MTSENIEAPVFLERIQEATHLVKKAGEHLTGDDKDATNAAMQKLDEVKILAEDYEDLISEHMLLYVLASVGTQMAAFVHEINALLGASQTIEQALEGVLAEDGLSLDERRRFRRTLNVATELKRSLERQASYLMDVVTVDARRRRSRQRLCERFDAAVRLVQHQAERRGIKIDNRIPSELRSPPMFPAEITAIFANLLTNAVKAAGEDGHIFASASSADDQVRIRIQNTGTAVQLNEAERWFKPFQSTTSEVNPVLGQGMGLGLTITRNLLENYGAVVKFSQPDSPFATAVEIALPSQELTVIMKNTEKPSILVIDDEPEKLRDQFSLGVKDRAVPNVFHPQDINISDLKDADLVLVDYALEYWSERDNLSTISLQPANGMALAVVLREQVDQNEKDKLTAFALHTARLRDIKGRFAPATAQHVLARLNNLEWIFQKKDPNRYNQIILLADAVRRASKPMVGRFGFNGAKTSRYE